MSGAAALQTQTASGALWGRAAALAAALHFAALAAAVITLRGEIDDDASGAPAIEISLEPAAPRVEDALDHPPGPVSNESAAAPASVAASETKQTDAPQVAGVQAEDAEFSRSEKKSVEEAKTQQNQSAASTESAASEATAPPKTEAPLVSDRPRAPAPGADAAAKAAVLTWQKALIGHLNRAKRYPAGARRTAEVLISFTLDRRGHIVGYSVKKSSGQKLFDDAALAMMKRADPAPAPPAAIADEGLSFEVPVQFRADRK